MTEEIIVDGVNVAECEYYKGKCMEYTHYCQIGCKECTDIGTKLCHYKQTERFKAKIARLEQENKDFEILAKSLYKRIEELEKENEALAFRERLYKTDYEASEQENKQMKSALEEIREKIKSLNKDICNNCGWYNTDNCQPNGYICHDLIEIKDKINEVLK